MSIDLRYAALLARIQAYQGARRSESAAFLIWYLVNYYRLDELEATDCVCDQAGDKGIDGIYVNQGAVKARDFKSNHPIQARLQQEFKKHYGGSYALAVKRGEPIGSAVTISNEVAGLTLIAFDLGEPWTTHRKYQVFDERYNEVFGRPEVTAGKIVMLQIAVALESRLVKTLVASYRKDLLRRKTASVAELWARF
ncbi:hypothetical protein [Duganella sp.]|uniref:hypothetical protein n=1 Tax=Duganella sp. TaxID=1904440 RepID=UPI0031DB0F07